MGQKGKQVELVGLDEVVLPPKQWKKLKRDRGQIEEMRRQVEEGECMVPIIVYERPDGKLGIEDGRHRYIAHVLAEAEFIAVVFR